MAHSPTVVVCRAAKGPEDPYAVALAQAGFKVYFVPLLHFEFRNEQEVATALLDSSKYSGLIFTSQTAVDACKHALSKTGDGWQYRLAEQWRNLPVFVVGKATSQTVERLGLKTAGSVSGNAETLSQAILEYFSSRDKSSLQSLLFPCGQLRRETLPSVLQEAGLGLNSLICYNTVAHPHIAENLRTLAEEKVLVEGCWVVLFSPSGVQFALEPLNSLCTTERLKFAAIGPTTAGALTSVGIQPAAMASKPNAESLVEAITTVTAR